MTRDGYNTIDGIKKNYVPIIRSEEYVHRKTIELSSYYALADGMGILVRPFTANKSEDFRLLFKRKTDKYPSTIAVGADAYENIDFMSQIELPDGTMVSLPTMAFEAVADAKTQKGALGGIFDYARKKMKHVTGDRDALADHFRPIYDQSLLSRIGLDSIRRRGRQPFFQRRSHRTVPRSRASGRTVHDS